MKTFGYLIAAIALTQANAQTGAPQTGAPQPGASPNQPLQPVQPLQPGQSTPTDSAQQGQGQLKSETPMNGGAQNGGAQNLTTTTTTTRGEAMTPMNTGANLGQKYDDSKSNDGTMPTPIVSNADMKTETTDSTSEDTSTTVPSKLNGETSPESESPRTEPTTAEKSSAQAVMTSMAVIGVCATIMATIMA